ncbi:hypothetical protein LR48_Vigan10g151500 [Vigna angularis]|uniref:Uncharacterized protein n=1 Tax=Phaseolus angularis TaxID=3914 RepID=A0A0L9VKX2_PHAAN|nr:hypothetical protein LR48_Vigan10g151500 [Vigna angularis]
MGARVESFISGPNEGSLDKSRRSSSPRFGFIVPCVFLSVALTLLVKSMLLSYPITEVTLIGLLDGF